jgi:hypothetical protein
MSFPEAAFKIIEDNHCPIYNEGDIVTLSGKALLLKRRKEKTFVTTSVVLLPKDKSVCRILVSNLTSVLIEYGSVDNLPGRHAIACSGCTGTVRLKHSGVEKSLEAAGLPRDDSEIGFATKLLTKFPIFESLRESDVKKLVPMLKMKKFPRGASIIKKGDPGSNLYIILAGKAEVLVDDGISIGFMERGEVFGEISLLIGTPAGATIKVVNTVTVLLIYGKDFKRVLNTFPSLQMYFARLLAKRLAKTNVERFEEIAPGMSGKLQDNPPSELLQTLNLNRKTGMLTLNVASGVAELAFKEGGLIRAKHNNKEGQEAFFAVLGEKEGRFKFVPRLSPKYDHMEEIGDFMWLLMEGIRRVDENRA